MNLTTATPACTNSRTILIAEDDFDDQELIMEALLAADPHLSMHTVLNGNAVLRYLNNCTPDQLPQLLILDYNLPELDGAEVLQQLLQNGRYRSIPKIVWSTSNAAQYQARCMQLGATVYLVKPCTVTGIEAMAHQMVALCSVTA